MDLLMPRFLLALTISVAALAAPAAAVPITFAYSGTVQTTAVGVTAISIGDSVTGQFTFDSNAVDLFPDLPNVGIYATLGSTMSVAGFHATQQAGAPFSNGSIQVGPGNGASGGDTYLLGATAALAGPVLGRPLVAYVVQLEEPAGYFSDDSLPLSPPTIPTGPLSETSIQLVFDCSGPCTPDDTILATLDSLTLVPEPASGLLLPAALLVRRLREQSWRSGRRAKG